MTARPTTGVRRVDRIEEGGWLACLYGPTDLDDLLVELVPILSAMRDEDEGSLAVSLEWSWGDPEAVLELLDEPTIVERDPWNPHGGLRVAVWRKVPCPPNVCGEHSWHSVELEWPEDGAPLPRGAFIGVQPWN